MCLSSVDECFPCRLHTEEQKAEAKTVCHKELAEVVAHCFCVAKMQTAPRAGLFGFNWYSPGVSTTTISDNNNNGSLFPSNCGNTVAAISDSTRALNCDGSVTERKAVLMKYLGGIRRCVARCAWARGTRKGALQSSSSL